MRDQAKGFPDDRVCCSSCGRRMVPWMVTYLGEILRTVCPFCTETHQDFTPEFPSVIIWISVVCVVLYGLCSFFSIQS
jgi:hypothetical protein